MNNKILKYLIKFGLPAIGAAVIVCGSIIAISQASKATKKVVVHPDKLSLSANIGTIDAVSNEKTISSNKIKINTEPSNAIKDVDYSIYTDQGEDAPDQIYINNDNELVIDKGIDPKYDNTTWKIEAFAKKNKDWQINIPSDNELTFNLKVKYVPSGVIGIRWQNDGSTELSAKADEIKYIQKSWTAEIQKQTGLWSVGSVNYEIEPAEFQNVINVDKDGYVYTTGKADKGQTFDIKVKATASEDTKYTLESDDILVNIESTDQQIDKLVFISSFDQEIVNFHSQWESQMPFIVSAYDDRGEIITSPKITYYLIDAPKYITIDKYGYLHVNSNNINTYTSCNFSVCARSDVKGDIYISTPVNIVIMDTLNNDLYNFDPNTKTIISLKPKFTTWANSQGGIITIPDNISGVNIEKFSNNVFKDCFALKQIILPTTLTSIGTDCFKGCTNLSKITVNSAATVSSCCFATQTNTNIIFNNEMFGRYCEQMLPKVDTKSAKTSFWLGNKDHDYYVEQNYPILNNKDNILYKNLIYSGSNNLTHLTFSSTSYSSLASNLNDLAKSTPQSYSTSTQKIFTLQEYDWYDVHWFILLGVDVKYHICHRDYTTRVDAFNTCNGIVSVNDGTASQNYVKDPDRKIHYAAGKESTYGHGYKFDTGIAGRWKDGRVAHLVNTKVQDLNEFWDNGWW